MNNKAKLTGIAPLMVVKDVVRSAEYYRAVLGFEIINFVGDPQVYAMTERNGFQIHSGKSDDGSVCINENARKGTPDLIIWVPEIENLFDELKSRNAVITEGITGRAYGREFIIRDCDNHKILIVD